MVVDVPEYLVLFHGLRFVVYDDSLRKRLYLEACPKCREIWWLRWLFLYSKRVLETKTGQKSPIIPSKIRNTIFLAPHMSHTCTAVILKNFLLQGDTITLEQYRDYLMSKGASRHTANDYAGDVSIFVRWLEDSTGETFAPESVTTIDVREYISYLANVRRQKLATVDRKVRALKNFFDWLVGTGRVKANPVMGVRLPRETKRPPKKPHGARTVQD